MDIELYRTFLAICDSKSFTLAAQQVNRTQSAVSQQVKRLEAMLGHPLFERSATHVDVTQFGKALIPQARSIVETHTDILQTFRRANFAGNIVIGVADAYVNRILKDVLTEFARVFPEAAINIVIDDSFGLSRRIADGSVDIAFITEGNAPARGPVVFTDRVVVVGPEAAELWKDDPLPLVVWDVRNEDEAPLLKILGEQKRGYRNAVVCRSVQAQHVAITAGLGVGVLVEGSMVPGERAYLEPDGFPVLKHINIRLDRTYANRSRTIERLIDHYVDFFRTGGT
jgi:DNA-binding transcriptional LysR family regulator